MNFRYRHAHRPRGNAERLHQRIMARPFVVEFKAVAVMPDLHDAAKMFEPRLRRPFRARPWASAA